MARAAVLGRLTWQVGTVTEIREESPTARTIVLDVPGWPGHAAGQHVDVSPYLTDILRPGYPLELRGPIGGWFVWDPAEPGPVLLVAGGSGVVPLMSMIRARAEAGSQAPFRLVYSVRSPDTVLYAAELERFSQAAGGFQMSYVYTRSGPPGVRVRIGRLTPVVLSAPGWTSKTAPAVFICGPTGFVEAAASLLVKAGHQAGAIKTERFGPSGG